MNEKEKYLELMRRYFDAETSSREEKELAQYAASTDDPAFGQLRGVLGYLSIGRQERARRRTVVIYRALAAAASVVVIAAIGLNAAFQKDCIQIDHGTRVENDDVIMASVETSLADFFGEVTPAETNLKEMFER